MSLFKNATSKILSRVINEVYNQGAVPFISIIFEIIQWKSQLSMTLRSYQVKYQRNCMQIYEYFVHFYKTI